MMKSASELQSGKGHRDENFPVASRLIHPRHRDVILAFYRYARTADDIADHATAGADDKLRLLEEMRRTVLGETDAEPTAAALRALMTARSLNPQHAVDLLVAFSRDVTKLRYRDWDELMDYCRYSAMPVGRFVLDVHGEARKAWPASDALCSALQVVNHLQDCGKDYRNLDRVYIPLDMLAASGSGPAALGETRASPTLLGAIAAVAKRNANLLVRAKPFAGQIRDCRLALEVGVIQRLAEDLNRRLLARDPLSERVHHRKSEAMGIALSAAAGFFGRRLWRKPTPPGIAEERP
jgi:hydroxysqualene synthase